MTTFESIKKEYKDNVSFKEEYISFRDLLFKLVNSVCIQFEKETELPADKFYDKLICTKYLNRYCTDMSEAWVVINFEISPKSFFKSAVTICGTVGKKDSNCCLKLSSVHGLVTIDHLRLLRESIENTFNKYFPE